jgi:hypothetical protein
VRTAGLQGLCERKAASYRAPSVRCADRRSLAAPWAAIAINRLRVILKSCGSAAAARQRKMLAARCPDSLKHATDARHSSKQCMARRAVHGGRMRFDIESNLDQRCREFELPQSERAAWIKVHRSTHRSASLPSCT